MKHKYEIETLRGTFTACDWAQICIDSETQEDNRFVCFIDEEGKPQMIDNAEINIIIERRCNYGK